MKRFHGSWKRHVGRGIPRSALRCASERRLYTRPLLDCNVSPFPCLTSTHKIMGDIPGHFVGYSPKLPYPELRLFPTLAEPAVRSVSRFDCSVSAGRALRMMNSTIADTMTTPPSPETVCTLIASSQFYHCSKNLIDVRSGADIAPCGRCGIPPLSFGRIRLTGYH